MIVKPSRTFVDSSSRHRTGCVWPQKTLLLSLYGYELFIVCKLSSNTRSGGLDLDHGHHHAPLYNCLRIRNQQFGKSFEWMITTAEMGCGDEWTKAFLSGLDDWVDLSLLLLPVACWVRTKLCFYITSDCCLLLNPEAAVLQEPSFSPNLPGFPGAVPGAAAWQVLDTSAMISSF